VAADRVRQSRTSKGLARADAPSPTKLVDETATIDQLPSAVLEAARFFVASLPRRDAEGELTARLGFTSALSGEGVSYIARAAAVVLAHDLRERVCVVDLNWRPEAQSPAVARHRRRHRKAQKLSESPAPLPGLADVLRRETSLREVIYETADPGLSVVVAGHATPAEGQVFAHSDRLSQILQMLERHHDRLILDLPSVLGASASIPLARRAGSVALVVREGVTTESQVRVAIERLGDVPSLGVVLNRASSKIPRPLLRRISTW
jgi:Mrp family chromosome partitioning ATPase